MMTDLARQVQECGVVWSIVFHAAAKRISLFSFIFFLLWIKMKNRTDEPEMYIDPQQLAGISSTSFYVLLK